MTSKPRNAAAAEPPAEAPGSLVKSFLSGGFGGMCLVAAGHPLDLIKVRLQTMKVTPGQPAPYTGMLDVARKTIQAEGVRGLYRGMSAPLAGVTPIFAVCFWAYDVGAKLVRSFCNVADTEKLSMMQIGAAGAFSAVPTTAIMAPGERIKVLLQIQGQQGVAQKYKGPVDVVRSLVREEGAASLFRGSAATLLRDGTGSFAYFSVYEGIKRALSADGGQLSPFAVIMGGGFAGVCNWAIAIPFDTVKSRIQSGAASGSMLSVSRAIVHQEGFQGLFQGIGPAMVRAFPANAACFLGMEVSKAVLTKMGL